jgi:beta-lactamase regulating signal transducer with metallopeptidase domain
MTTLENLLIWPPLHHVGLALVHFLWQGTVVALALAAVLFCLRRSSAQARYLSACVALTAMQLLPLATFWISQGRPAAEEKDEPARALMLLPAGPAPGQLAAQASSARLPADMPTAGGSEDGSASGQTAESSRPVPTFLFWVVFAWASGVLLLSARLVGGWCLIQRMKVRQTRPAAQPWQETLTKLGKSLGLSQSVRLLESTLVQVPTVIGWVHPVVLAPASAFMGLSADQLTALLVHELAHIRRQDYLVNLIQSLVETLLFYHPAVWWVSGRIRLEREHCCDDCSVQWCGNRLLVAQALANMETLRQGRLRLVAAANGASLLGRIRRLLGVESASPAYSARQSAGLVVLALTAILALSFGVWTQFIGAGERLVEDTEAPTNEEPTASGDSKPDVQGLIKQLGSREFSERQAAMKKLEALGEKATKEIREAADKATDPELRRRLVQILEDQESKAFDKAFNEALHEETVTKDYPKAAQLFEALAKARATKWLARPHTQEDWDDLLTTDAFVHLARCYAQLEKYADAANAYGRAQYYSDFNRKKRDQIRAECSEMALKLIPRWEKAVREQVEKDPVIKKLASKYPLVVLHSRRFASGGGYLRSAFSFISETADEEKHGNDVQLLFDNGGRKGTFDINMLTNQQNLVVDLGAVPFERDPDPKTIDIDAENSWQVGGHANEGHVYLERVRDERGNRFYVVFQIVAVDPQKDYMAFVWRRLPGGRVKH